MFKKNEDYKQIGLFGSSQRLSNKQKKIWDSSIENKFFEAIFSKINEENFKGLYSDKKSRPNVPVNQLVGALILKYLFNWTYNDLFRNLNFNSLSRHAIGIDDLEQDIFSEASIYNFQNKIINHFTSTGIDLLSQEFDVLTSEQLKEFGIKTDIQRGDSFLIGSNIFDFTRLQLLIEVIIRLGRILDDTDKTGYSSIISSYNKQSSGQYIYKIKKDDLPHELNKLASLYHELFTLYNEKYSDIDGFRIFTRVYQEHFTVVENKIEVVPSGDLNSNILMSPDDEDAAFRTKRTSNCKGFSGHVSETSNPENEINLITDVVVEKSNADDAKILEERLPGMCEKTPELAEYHADGNYGSPKVDEFMIKNNIALIQNSIRGKISSVKKEIREDKEGIYWVTCENGQRSQAVRSTKKSNTKRWRVDFDYSICEKCSLLNKCNIKTVGGKTTPKKKRWYFGENKINIHKRIQNKEKIPEERWKNRSNVEATVKELKRGMRNEKVRVRTKIKTSFYMVLTAIAINLTRIHKYSLVCFCLKFINSWKKTILKTNYKLFYQEILQKSKYSVHERKLSLFSRKIIASF